MTLLLTAVLVSMTVAYLSWRHALRSIVAGRPALDDAELIKQFSPGLSPPVVLNVLKLVGECYGIPYAKIRPEDCIIKDYSKADSWQLDAGAERLDEALKRKFNIMVPEKLDSMKVKDLVVIVTNGSKS